MSTIIAVSEYTQKCEDNEAQYIAMRDSLGKSLSKALQIKGAIASYELKLQKAVAEFNEELKVIESNFSAR